MRCELRRGWCQGLTLAGLVASLASPAGAVTLSTPTSAFLAVGQGVQVAPDWMLTVVHYAFSVGDTYTNGYGSWTVAARYDAPGSGTFPANDLSLLRLVPVGSSSAPYLAINSTLPADGGFAPVDVTIASAANTSGPRSVADTTVDRAQAVCGPVDDCNPTAVPVNWLVSDDAQVYVQDGDSGSGLFFGHVPDSSVLIGLTSARLEDSDKLPTGSAFVQPAAYRAWIDATMAADTADGETLLWTAVPVPEPAAAWLTAAGLALLALRRRAWP
jgi:hypothetical protein